MSHLLRLSRKAVWLTCAALVPVLASAAGAQFLDQGALTGVVQDPSGALVPGAQVLAAPDR
jgi:hypothetical protein